MHSRFVLICCCIHAILALRTAARPAAFLGDWTTASASGLLQGAWDAARGDAEKSGDGAAVGLPPSPPSRTYVSRWSELVPEPSLSAVAAAQGPRAARTSSGAPTAADGGDGVARVAGEPSTSPAAAAAAVAPSRSGRSSGPSAQDLRETIIPHLRQLEQTMDRSTFLVLWHLMSHNVHGSWEEATARYAGDFQQATTDKRRACANACLNGGKCYHETDDSKQWRCMCPNEFWGRRCQHGTRSASRERSGSKPGSSHSEYAVWANSWTTKRA